MKTMTKVGCSKAKRKIKQAEYGKLQLQIMFLLRQKQKYHRQSKRLRLKTTSLQLYHSQKT